MSDAPTDLPDDWEERDWTGSWWLAMNVVGERVKAGAAAPEFMRGERDWMGER